MKLSEEMDVELTSTSRNNGAVLPVNESLKISKNPLVEPQENSKPHISNGENGTKYPYPAEGSINGHLSDGRAVTNSDSDEIGFEVESYSDFNSPLPPDSHSEEKSNNDEVDKIDELKERTFEDVSSEDNLSDIEKLATEQDLTHDSSHLSEEFQLRLSDDDDCSDETSQNRNLRISAVESVSSTTLEVTTKSTSLENVIKDGDGDNSSGSGTLEGNTLANDSLFQESTSSSKPNDTPNDESHQTRSQNLVNPDKDSCIKNIDVEQNIENRDDNEDKALKDKLENTENCELSNSASVGTPDERRDMIQADEDCKAAEDMDPRNDQCKTTVSSKVTCVLSLEDKLDAELEAELQAEIAAEMQIMDKRKTVSGSSNKDNIVDSATKPVDSEDKVESENKKCEVSTLNEKSEIMSESADIQLNIVKKEPLDMADEKEVLKIDRDAIKLDVEAKAAIKLEIEDKAAIKLEIEDKAAIELKVEGNATIKPDVVQLEKIHDHNCKCVCCTIEVEDDTNLLKLDEIKPDLDIKLETLNCEEPSSMECESEDATNSTPKDVEVVTKKSETLQSKTPDSEENLVEESEQELISPAKGLPTKSTESEETLILGNDKDPLPMVPKENKILQCDDIEDSNSKIGEESLPSAAKQIEAEHSGETSSSESKQEPPSNGSKVLLDSQEVENSGNGKEVLSLVEKQNEVPQSEDVDSGGIRLSERGQTTCVNPETDEKTACEQSTSNQSEVLMGENGCSEEARREKTEEEPSSNVSDKKTDGDNELDPSNSSLLIPSEPNSPVSDNDYECPMSESDDPASVEISDNGGGMSNGDDSDTMCEDESNMTDETESESKKESGKTEKIVSGVDKVSSSEVKDSNLSASLDFCDSTVLDASSNDDLDSQDCSSSANENTNAKGYRKRTLSHSDDSCSVGSFKSKKLDKLNTHDSGHKRPAENSRDSDPKKLRVNDSGLTKDLNLEKEKDIPGQREKDILPTSQESLKLTSERAAANAVSTDLPFLRKLHRKELSNMSRSDLEELVLQKICEAITERSMVGDLRLRCQALENRQEKENEKFNKLRKQMHELNLVMRKYLDNQRRNIPNPPIKVTRSVGLQVQPATQVALRGWFPQSPNAGAKPPPPQPGAKSATSIPSKPDSPMLETPIQTHQGKPKKAFGASPRAQTPVSSNSDPPALVPTGSQTAGLVMPSRPPPATPPRISVPPLQQISGVRPRFGITNSTALTPSQVMQVPPKQQSPLPKQSSPLNTNKQKASKGDVEVIDIIDKDDSNKRSGVHISIQQQQHQQKQAANAAAQSLAGNSGMTVQLIPPAQIPQSMAPGYSQLLVPSSTMPQKMILTSPPGNCIRANLKFVMKGNHANVIIPIQQNNGVAVSSGVVHIPSSTQAAVQQIFTNASTGNRTNTVAVRQIQSSTLHPAPLPTPPVLQGNNPAWRQVPPRPNLKIQHQNNGIVLSWNMALGPAYADIESYQLFAYQEGVAPPSASLWKKVGDVKALPLPMACTLTQFVEGHRYHFSVRAVDKHGRVGPFSQQGSIRLGN